MRANLFGLRDLENGGRRLGVALLAGLLAGACAGEPRSSVARLVVEGDGAVSFPAVVAAAGFAGGKDLVGYHLVVWSRGEAADGALFRTAVSDVAVLDALEGLGAEPGDALGIDSWDERHQPDSPAPDRVITGPIVEVLVRLADGRQLRLDEILEDPGGRGFAMRFGGHRHNIEEWHSGCVVCLYSCPGSKVGNERYTVRDFAAGATRFRPRAGVLPPDGSEVEVVLRLLDPAMTSPPQ